MDLQLLSIIAGTISSFIFAGSNIPMLWKVYRTRDVHSYSWLNVLMINIGNLLYWFYVVNLPFGPIWILHTFYTVASGILLILYVRFHTGKLISWHIGLRIKILEIYVPDRLRLRRMFPPAS